MRMLSWLRPLPLAIQSATATTIRLYVMGQGPAQGQKKPRQIDGAAPKRILCCDPWQHQVGRPRATRGAPRWAPARAERSGWGDKQRLHAHGARRRVGDTNRTLQRNLIRALTASNTRANSPPGQLGGRIIRSVGTLPGCDFTACDKITQVVICIGNLHHVTLNS